MQIRKKMQIQIWQPKMFSANNPIKYSSSINFEIKESQGQLTNKHQLALKTLTKVSSTFRSQLSCFGTAPRLCPSKAVDSFDLVLVSANKTFLGLAVPVLGGEGALPFCIFWGEALCTLCGGGGAWGFQGFLGDDWTGRDWNCVLQPIKRAQVLIYRVA